MQAVGEGCGRAARSWRGMGLEGLTGWLRRKNFFLDAIDMFDTASRGDPHWMAIQFMKTMKVDRVGGASCCSDLHRCHHEWLAAFTMPTLVLCGTEDHDNGSAAKLAEALPNADMSRVPGTHMPASPSPNSALP